MKKFITGIAVGMLSMVLVYVGIDVVGAEEKVTGPPTEEQSKDMQLAWYQYHHQTLSDALEGKCEIK